MDISPEMVYYLKFLFSLSLYTIINAGFIQDQLFDGIVMHIDRLNAECRGQNVACQGFFQGVKTETTTIFVKNFTFVVNEGGLKKLMYTITIDRCRSKENLDTCEEYFKPPRMDFCKLVDPNNLLTGKTSIAIPLEPLLRCPLNKGIYHAYNVTYDLAPFIFFKLEGWYWKIKMDIFTPEENRVIYCVHTEGYVTNSKSNKN